MYKPSRARSLAVLVAAGIAVTWATVGYPQAVAVAQAPGIAQAKSAAPAAASTRAMLDRYCVSCHNEKLKTAGLVLDAAALTNLTKDGELWEKVIRKLRAGAMPPPGAPRPQPDISDAVATYLETELDRGASARPNPGYIGPFHRLSRTEYQNAIRDLLALEVLPKELDITTMLLPDNSSSGFDNLADILFVSPTAQEGY
jgi:mono/diheme cytochrome c family protein